MRLGQSDLEAVVSFLGDVAGLDMDAPYPLELVARMRSLVASEAVFYQDVDLGNRRFGTMVGVGDDDDTDTDEIYWATGPCPIARLRSECSDLSAVRMSDVVERRRYHELPVYREYFRPAGVEHMVDLGLPAGPQRHRSFIFFRTRGSRDFSERDRAVLETLRPHLLGMEAHAERRRRLAAMVTPAVSSDAAAPPAGLTPREREIVMLVAQGKTNAEIAAELWVAPSTVKKHLENVYVKLGVGRRSAVAGWLALH